jgi:hypothetical protein
MIRDYLPALKIRILSVRIKKLLHQRNISSAVGAITYYEKTTQYKYKLRNRDKVRVLGYGGAIVVDGRYGLE